MNTWDAELEWFLCQADAQCGVGSNFMPTIRRIQVGMFSGTINPDPYTDSQVGLGSRKVRAFERERQAHRRWCKLSEHMRDIAVAHYCTTRVPENSDALKVGGSAGVALLLAYRSKEQKRAIRLLKNDSRSVKISELREQAEREIRSLHETWGLTKKDAVNEWIQK